MTARPDDIKRLAELCGVELVGVHSVAFQAEPYCEFRFPGPRPEYGPFDPFSRLDDAFRVAEKIGKLELYAIGPKCWNARFGGAAWYQQGNPARAISFAALAWLDANRPAPHVGQP